MQNFQRVGIGCCLILVGFFTTVYSSSPTYAQPLVGWEAELSTIFHDVAGTVTIVDADTFRVDNFAYDGTAPSVYFYLGVDESNAAFLSGYEVSPLFDSTAYDGTQGPQFFDLTSGDTFDGYNSISVWCSLASVNFGSGTFAAPVPEPASLLLVGLGMIGMVSRRIR